MVFTDADESKGDYSLFFERWTIDELAAGETATLDLTLFTLVEGVDIENFVEVIALDQEDADSSPDNGTGTPVEDDEAVVTITPADDGGFGGEDGEANLSLTIEADTDTYEQYENVRFTITLTNDGPDEATSIRVAAGLPDGLVYSDDNTSQGDYSLFFETWSLESLASGESAVLELDLFTLIESGAVTAYAEVFEAGQFDPNSTPGNGDGENSNEDDEAVVVIEGAEDRISFRNSDRSTASATVTMDRLYPTPTDSQLNLDLINDGEYTEAAIFVYDLQGKQLIQENVILEEGFNNYRLNVSDLPDGSYFVNVLNENGTLITKPFVKASR